LYLYTTKIEKLNYKFGIWNIIECRERFRTLEEWQSLSVPTDNKMDPNSNAASSKFNKGNSNFSRIFFIL
jgi:hypothetical protein